MKLGKFLWAAIITVSVTAVTLAQGENICPLIVRTAFDNANTVCEGTERNQACYGNTLLEADGQSDTAELEFDNVGDIVNAEDIRSLRLSAMDAEASQWGLALMKIQANIPDSTPSNVTLLLFGDVQVQDTAVNLPTAPFETLTNANVRRGPMANSVIVDSIDAGGSIVANGRLQDNSWVRVSLPDDAVGYGWINGALLHGDVEALQVVQPSEPVYGPMQAFTFVTGAEEAPCAEAPRSGLLVQTPEGVGEVRIVLNQVAIRLGSTVFFEAQAGGNMQISVLEGHARVAAHGQTRYVPAGAQVTVPLDENALPAGAPNEPHPYDADEFDAFTPIVAGLPKSVEVARPVDVNRLAYDMALAEGRLSPRQDDDSQGPGAGPGVANAIDAVQSAAGTAPSVLATALDAVQAGDTVQGLVDETTDGLSSAVDGAVGAVTDVVDVAGATVTGVTEAASGAVAPIVDTVVTVVDATGDTVQEVVDQTPLDGTVVGDVVEAVVETSVVTGTIGSVTGSLGGGLFGGSR